MQVQSAGAIFKCNTERLSGCTQVHLGSVKFRTLEKTIFFLNLI